jgi:NADH dehydrogenase [ubiquinone] 1 alpha subcomplex assembly factor 5
MIDRQPAHRPGKAKSTIALSGAVNLPMSALSSALHLFTRGEMNTQELFASDIFDRQARRVKRNKMLRALPEDQWIIARMAEELISRFSDEGRIIRRALWIGSLSPGIRGAFKALSVKIVHADACIDTEAEGPLIPCDEDFLPFSDNSFDAVFAVGTLDSVNDLPGALTLIRRTLRPGGLFFGSFLGAGSLATLKKIVHSVEPSIARTHPQIDVRGAGDLLARAGFADPVADMEMVIARYSTLQRLLKDLDANGLRNSLKTRAAICKSDYTRWNAAFDLMREGDGKVSEWFAPIFMTGRSPPEQPTP